MGLNIKKPETEAKIRRLAAKTGENLTEAVTRAVEEKLARIEDDAARKASGKTYEEMMEAIRPLQEEAAAFRRARGDRRSFEQFMKDFEDEFYDENGAPK